MRQQELEIKDYIKPWSNELDFSQYNMQNLSSGKSRDRLTTLFIHVETCRNMLYVVEGSLIGIKNVSSTNVVQQYISFVFVVRAQFGTNVAAKCLVRLTTQSPNDMQQCATECPINVVCCIRKVELVLVFTCNAFDSKPKISREHQNADFWF